ncbi:tryptophan-rich sensory protein [Agromyces seonyuensis]|uniref:Tryptophan-rich sensory protein n=1 Tax=Agromyces seonyuensis TaxID=2662446 RepID=A0A6I4NZH0_9MICO|nr:tryptophan-rich sensory protein [Agromyces seonyuensis]MWB99678.1 tryptophan-rich sensory protein [Agromyces seonyuensis]
MPRNGTTSTKEQVAAGDLLRQIAVAAAAAIAVVAGLSGAGVFGGVRAQDVDGGALDSDATHLAPGSGALVIWTAICVGYVLFAIWQFFPNERTKPRQRAAGWWVAMSMLLNAVWILVVQAGLVVLSVLVVAALLAALAVAFRQLQQTEAAGPIDVLVADGTVGLSLGWVSVASAANVAAALVAVGFDGFGWPADVWSVLIILVLTGIGIAIAIIGRGRFAPAIAIVWGLAWIAVARLTDDPYSLTTAIAAFVAATVIALVTVVSRLRTLAVDDDPV